MAKHCCQKELDKAKRLGTVKSDGRAEEGDLWRCSCGTVYVHLCDEAEGCCWEPTHDCTEVEEQPHERT